MTFQVSQPTTDDAGVPAVHTVSVRIVSVILGIVPVLDLAVLGLTSPGATAR